MPCGALQVIGNRIMILVAQCVLDHSGHHRCDATELRMAKRVAGALLGEKTAVRVARALRDDHGAIFVLVYLGLDRGDEAIVIEIDFREQNQYWDIVILD